MLNKKIARRYAQALIEIGKENNRVEEFKTELENFSDLLKKFPKFPKRSFKPALFNRRSEKNNLGGG